MALTQTEPDTLRENTKEVEPHRSNSQTRMPSDYTPRQSRDLARSNSSVLDPRRNSPDTPMSSGSDPLKTVSFSTRLPERESSQNSRESRVSLNALVRESLSSAKLLRDGSRNLMRELSRDTSLRTRRLTRQMSCLRDTDSSRRAGITISIITSAFILSYGPYMLLWIYNLLAFELGIFDPFVNVYSERWYVYLYIYMISTNVLPTFNSSIFPLIYFIRVKGRMIERGLSWIGRSCGAWLDRGEQGYELVEVSNQQRENQFARVDPASVNGASSKTGVNGCVRSANCAVSVAFHDNGNGNSNGIVPESCEEDSPGTGSP